MIALLLAYIKRSEFSKNIAKLLTGTILVNLITFTLTPFLTRVYSPESFGVFQQFISISSALVVLATLSFHFSIMLPREKKEFDSVVSLNLLSILIMTILITLALSLLPPSLSIFRNVSEIYDKRFIIPLIVMNSALFTTLQNVLLARKQFFKLTMFRVLRATLGLGGALLISKVLVDYLGLLSSYVVSFGILCAFIIIDQKVINSLKYTHLTDLKFVFKKYIKFPLFDTPSMFINSVSNELPVFMLTIFFQPEIVGFYSLAFRTLKIPFNLLGSSIGEAYFQRSSELNNFNKDKLPKFFWKMILVLAVTGMVPLLIIYPFTSSIVHILFGNGWETTAVIMKILMVWLYFEFIYIPVSTSFVITKKLEVLLIINISLLVCRIIFMFLFRYNLFIMLISLSAISSVFYIISIISAFLVIKEHANA